MALLQAAASTAPGTGGGLPFGAGSGGLPDLSSLFGAAAGTGTGGPGGLSGPGVGAAGFGSTNFAEMQRQVGSGDSFK